MVVVRWGSSCLAATVVLLCASAPGGASPRSEARAHLAKANREFVRKHYRAALEEYEKSYDLQKLADVELAIGKCHLALKEWNEASDAFTEYLKSAPRSPKRAAVKKLIATSQKAAAREARAQALEEQKEAKARQAKEAKEAKEAKAANDAKVADDHPDTAATVTTGTDSPPEGEVAATKTGGDAPGGETAVTAALPTEEGGIEIAPIAGFFEDFQSAGPNRFYSYGGMVVEIPKGKLTLLPELLVEWSPNGNRWGAVVGTTFDYGLTKRFGADAIVEVGNDLAGAGFGSAYYFAGAGLGASVYVGRWTFTPFSILYRGLNYSGWDVATGLNVSCVL